MHALALVGFVIAFGVAASPQDRPAPSEQPAAPAEDQEVLVARLMEQTKHLQSFTATYRGVMKGETAIVRLVYQAPGRAKFELSSDTWSVVIWILDGRCVMQSDHAADGFTADISCPDVIDRLAEFDRRFEETFPAASSATDELGAGPVFGLGAAPESEPENTIHFELNWCPQREHILLWYGAAAHWADAKAEDERLVRELAGGRREALSTRNGFIAEISRSDGSHLKLVDLSDVVADTDFTVTRAKEGWRDESVECANSLLAAMTVERRNAVYVHAAREKDAAQEESRPKLQRVFEALCRPRMVESYASWVGTQETEIGKFTDWLREQYEQTADQPKLRRHLAAAILQKRGELERALDHERDRYAGMVPTPDGLGLEPKQAEAITRVERAATRAIFEHDVGAPLLATFDEVVAAVQSGN
jgi:hypothetical protein